MYKVAVLGCENSHAGEFIKIVYEKKLITDIEFVGVYSDDRAAAEKLNERFGVPVMDRPDELVGRIDGLVVTARHGGKHYKLAKPYINDGIPMFIDKPITIDEDEAVEFMKELKVNGIKVVGGSCCVFAPEVQELKAKLASGELGTAFGGFLRAPVSLENEYGGFFFYSQHLVEVMCEVFGYYPKSVASYKNGKVITSVVRYGDYDVCTEYTDGCSLYQVTVNSSTGAHGGIYPVTGELYLPEFRSFWALLHGGKQEKSFRDFIAPVYILNAFARSIVSGKEETVNTVPEI